MSISLDYSKLVGTNCPICKKTEYDFVTHRFDSGCLVRCCNCQHIYLNPTLTDEMLSEIYVGQYYSYQNEERFINSLEEWRLNHDNPYQYALSYIESNEGFLNKSVLEVGCGPGGFLSECRNRGARVVGLDPNPDSARLAEKYYGLVLISDVVEETIQHADLTLPFDYIFGFEVIEHVREPQKFALTLHKFLKPGGVLIISTPNFHLFHMMGSAAPVVNVASEHLHYFEQETLKNSLEMVGFKVIDITSACTLNYSSRQKHILNKNYLVSRIWPKIRQINFIYKLKNMWFSTIETYHKETEVQEVLNGTSLVVVAQKLK